MIRSFGAMGSTGTEGCGATLSLQEAANTIWPVVVVGAGPAGALLAGQLALHGVRVLLVDRSSFPRPKVCGCSLNLSALGALQTAGLGELPLRLGAIPLHSVHLSSGRWSAQLAGFGVALSREALDTELVREACLRGAAFLPSTLAEMGAVFPEERHLILRQQNDQGESSPSGILGTLGTLGIPNASEATNAMVEVRAALVVAADGLGGRFSGKSVQVRVHRGSRIGAGTVLAPSEASLGYHPGNIYMACGRAGYVGLVVLEDGSLDIACALDRDALRQARGPLEVVRSLIESAGWCVPTDLEQAIWRGTPPLTRSASNVSAHRLFLVGDATGYIEPFTGEGLAWAFSSSIALAPLAARPWSSATAQAWEQLHHRLVKRRQRTCRWLAAVLRRPTLLTATVAVLSLFPGLANPVLRRLNTPA